MKTVNIQDQKSSLKPASPVPERLNTSAAFIPVRDENTEIAQDLKAREKELNCLYGLATIIETPGISLEEILQRVVNLLPAAFQSPEIVCARIVLRGTEYRTNNYADENQQLSAQMSVRGVEIGRVEISYLKDKSKNLQGLFLSGERSLIEAVAERLSRVVERMGLNDSVEDLRRMATVVKDSNDAVILYDFDGKILAWNQGAKEIFGYTEVEALGTNIREIIADSDREAALTMIQNVKLGGIVKSFELRRIAKDGRVLDVSLTSTLLRDETGKPVAIATTERDITERKRAEAALRQKMEDLSRLATVIGDSNDAVIMHDLDGKILAWNRGAKEMYGYTEAEALGKNVREIVAESDREAALTLIEKIKQGEIVKSFELRRLTKDGRILNIWLTTTLLMDESGKPVAIATTERDITERKRAEAVLQQKLEELGRMATVVSDSNDAVIMHDFDGKILAWNRGAKETYGYTEAEALGRNVRDIVATPDREAALTLIQNIKQGKLVKSFELRRLAKDGRVLDVWLTSTLLRDEKGQPIAIATTERDITERKRAEIALQEKVEDLRRMATVVSDSNDAVIMHDFDGKILAWNHGAQETYGYTEAEALTKNVREIVAEVDRDAALTLIENIKQGEVVKSFELRRLAKDGRILDVWLTTTLLRDESGKPVAIATTERDISERKQKEEEIRILNAGLEQRVVERTTQLQAANKELEAFSYSVSHDLRAPLRSIDGFSQVLLEDYAEKIDGTGQDALKRVRAAAQRMAQLIDDMLKLSRVTRSEMRLETVGLSAMVRAILSDLERTQPERLVDCVIEEGIVAKGDTQLLRAVLENLLGNSWKFTSKQGNARIEFGTTPCEGGNAYFVRDNGAGFDMAFVDKLFGAFQRLHTVEEFPGTGIGLATVQRIIHRHGGRVWAEGALGQGATFYFTLPEEAV